MERTAGDATVPIGLIDGPVAVGHPGLRGSTLHDVGGKRSGRCSVLHHSACLHGTFIAGILVGRRGSGAPAICPGSPLVLSAIFDDTSAGRSPPQATANDLAAAILRCVRAGARVLNVSAALYATSRDLEVNLLDALADAARRGPLVVVAAGNDGVIGSTALTGHPAVIPVVTYDRAGRPMNGSNVGRSIGHRGLGGPGENVTSLSPTGGLVALGGTSVAAPFVTGTIALLWALFPKAPGNEIKSAVLARSARSGLIPPLLSGAESFRLLNRRYSHA